MILNWTAELDDDGAAFGGTVDGELTDDLRPVFIAALTLAEMRYPDQGVTVTEISWTS